MDYLLLNAIKSIRNIEKHSGCFVIYDSLSKLLSNPEINKKNISNGLEYLTNNDTLKNKPINGKNFYFIVNETNQNKPDISHKKIPCPVNFEMPSVDLTVPSKIELTEICCTTKIMY